ncbi:hypothetical protein ACJX0J_033452, partial [Zea mays]
VPCSCFRYILQFFVIVMASNLSRYVYIKTKTEFDEYIKTKTEFDEYIKTKTEFDEYIKTKTEFDEYIKTKTEFDQVTSELHYKKKTSVIEHEQIISICSIQNGQIQYRHWVGSIFIRICTRKLLHSIII